MIIYKGFRIRIYPTKEQIQLFLRYIGACRFIWNYMLYLQTERFQNGEKHLSAFDMINLITPLKREAEFKWLSEIPRGALNITCQDLSNAYSRFFKKVSRKPKFKSRKKSKLSYPVSIRRFYFTENSVAIERVGKVKFKSDFKFPIDKESKFCNVRVSFDDNKWYVSFDMKCETQTPELTDKSMGIDLGIKELAVIAIDGNNEPIVFHNKNKSQKVRNLEKEIKRLQRGISRKYGKKKQGNCYVKTKNIEREEKKLRKAYRRLANIRKDYIHQTTHALVSMLPYRVVMEDLNITGMMKNRHLAKAVQEQCLYEFIRQMKYKCAWSGIEFVQADRFYPSSKTCSYCGAVKDDLKLKDRTYVCSNCGAVIDRDFNAAINLSRYVA